jgi:hypothetical protein
MSRLIYILSALLLVVTCFTFAIADRERLNQFVDLTLARAYFGDGNATNPTITFENDVDVGMFRVASNSLAFTTGGTQRWNINSSGHLIGNGTVEVRTGSGSAASPGFTFASDDDTGIYSSADGQMEFVTNGVRAWHIQSDGTLVHIGTNERIESNGAGGSTTIAGGSAAGAARVNLFGDTHSGDPGELQLFSGAVATADLTINAGHASAIVDIQNDSTTVATFDSGGLVLAKAMTMEGTLQDDSTTYIVAMNTADDTIINAPTGNQIEARINNFAVATIDSEGVEYPGTTTDLAVAGTTQGTAGDIVSKYVTVVSATSTAGEGVKLPSAVQGDVIHFANGQAAQSFELYPNTSDSINTASTDTSVVIAGSEGGFCIARTTSNWRCIVGVYP